MTTPRWPPRRPGAAGERAHYNRFYATGGWTYDTDRERRWLLDRVIRPLALRPPGRVLDIGCGTGLHSRLWHELGFQVTGVDVSETGIDRARRDFPGPSFVACDLEDFDAPAASFDVVFARGMTWYHYELDGINCDGVDVPARTGRLFDLLKPARFFVLQISTDFSGTNRGQGGVHFNRLSSYTSLFSRCGSVALLTNWWGQDLVDDDQAARVGANVVIATRKPP